MASGPEPRAHWLDTVVAGPFRDDSYRNQTIRQAPRAARKAAAGPRDVAAGMRRGRFLSWSCAGRIFVP